MWAITAPTRGAGKDLLDDVTQRPFTGLAMPQTNLPRGNNSDETLEKKLTGLFRDGATHVSFSNVTGTVNSPVLEQALTARRLSPRKPDPYYLLAEIHATAGRITESENALTLAKELSQKRNK